jgi:hypothetical protein
MRGRRVISLSAHSVACACALACAAIGLSCSALLTTPASQCARDEDCASRGFSGATCADGVCVPAPDAGGDAADAADIDPSWGCVGKITWPDEDRTRTTRVAGQLLRIFSNAPLPGVEMRLCGSLDVLCTAPLHTTVTDADGRYEQTVPYGFRGFTETRPPAGAEVMPMLIPTLPPPTEDRLLEDGGASIHDPSAADLDSLLGVVGKKTEPEAGHVIAVVSDCRDHLASQVVLEAEPLLPTSLAYYLDETGLPNPQQTQTSSRGSLGVINLPPGPVILKWRRDGRLLGTVSVQIRKGTLTAVALEPTPLNGEQ